MGFARILYPRYFILLCVLQVHQGELPRLQRDVRVRRLASLPSANGAQEGRRGRRVSAAAKGATQGRTPGAVREVSGLLQGSEGLREALEGVRGRPAFAVCWRKPEV